MEFTFKHSKLSRGYTSAVVEDRFFVDMSGQILSWWRQLSTKQWSGNKCGDVPIQIQTSSYAMDHQNWPGKQRLAEHQACRCTCLQRFLQTVKPFWRLILSIFCFLNESFLFQNSILLCQQNNLCRHVIFSQNCCFVANFVAKKRLSTTALGYACYTCKYFRIATDCSYRLLWFI